MNRYPVYLEFANDGTCMAHVPALPGCIVRAPTRDEAMSRLPGAIRDHYSWLRRHGEAALPPQAPVEIEVVSESPDLGPFDPGDAAALFPPDRAPIDPDEMEEHFRWMGYARADLLALVRDLPGGLLDWKPSAQSFSIRRLLRHVGNSEEWYVSRIAPSATLPPEWEDDEDLPILEFLEMERRTAVSRLRQLTAEERSRVFHPKVRTEHSDEPWTARKVLRRFLEHEREHTAQVQEILDARRRHLLSCLAAERAGLLEQLLDLDERVLTALPLLDGWTAKDVLAHVAEWDRWQHNVMTRMVAGEVPDLTALHDMDGANADIFRKWRSRSLSEVLSQLQDARAAWVTWLESLPLQEFFRRRTYSGDDWSFDTVPKVQWRHDREHAEPIAAWREVSELEGQTGSRELLHAAMDASREELLAAAALVPDEERASLPVCGVWTLKDVLGHIADWEWFCIETLRQFLAGKASLVRHDGGVDAWNEAKAAARREDPWQAVWDELHVARRVLLGVLDEMSQDQLGRLFPNPWDKDATPYKWIQVFLEHDRDHARGLRDARGFQ